LDKIKRTVTDDKVKLEVATISANNDSGVANIVVDAIGTAGLDGMVFLETSQDEKTTIEKQVGFRITPGMLYQNLYSDTSRPIMSYADIPVIMLDKKLYYAEEAEHILRVAMDVGFTSILIVAKDFIGDAPNTFIANHVKGTIQVAMAKVEDDITMDDLAVYLGGTIVSESGGRRVDSISKDDFVRSSRISLDPQKILITNDNPTKELDKRVKWLRSELEKNKEDGIMKRRIASLTNGIVTIKVGGRNAQEAREKAYRVEDAVNATRAAMRDGYLVGGGIALLQAFNSSDYKTDEELEVATVISKASINRIAKNAQIKIDWDRIDPKKNIGLNALTGEYEDLLLAGVVEPYKVTELALQNAISVAQMLTSIGTYILNDYERNDDKDK
jgi:chaperonin GroEL